MDFLVREMNTMEARRVKNYINGEWVDSETKFIKQQSKRLKIRF